MYVPKYFEPYEVVPESVYDIYRQQSHKIWTMFDDRLLITMDNIRKRYGKMVMNTYHWGGANQERGWRHEGTPTGAPLSQHKYGRAGDLIPIECSANSIRNDMLNDPLHPDFIHITCIEMGIPWLHIDTRNFDKLMHGILLVYPSA